MEPVLLYITAPNREEAISISKELVYKKFVACTNIIENVTSVYMWQGELEQNREVTIIAKTLNSKTQDTIKYIKSLHSYNCPAIIAVPIISGNPEYLRWIQQELTEHHPN
ncbi:MAG: divalent-cation tolerance protein CutA [Pseudomonadota bacterium]